MAAVRAHGQKTLALGSAPRRHRRSPMRAESDSGTTRLGASKAPQPGAQVSNRRPGDGLWKARRAWPHPRASRTPGAHHLTTQTRAGGYRWHVVLLLGLMV